MWSCFWCGLVGCLIFRGFVFLIFAMKNVSLLHVSFSKCGQILMTFFVIWGLNFLSLNCARAGRVGIFAKVCDL